MCEYAWFTWAKNDFSVACTRPFVRRLYKGIFYLAANLLHIGIFQVRHISFIRIHAKIDGVREYEMLLCRDLCEICVCVYTRSILQKTLETNACVRLFARACVCVHCNAETYM